MKPVAVTAAEAKKEDLLRNFTVQATVVPSYSTVVNAPATGAVIELPYQDGSVIGAGEVILKTDTTQEINMDLQREQLKQQLTSARQQYERLYGTNGEAQSAFASAESQYRLAQKNYDNGKIMAAEGYLPQIELEALNNIREVAYQQYIQAKANLSEERKTYYQEQIASYERQLDTMEEAFSPGTLVMPYTGILWETYVEKGEYLTQNQQVMKIYEEKSLKLEALVLAEDAAFMESAMEAKVTFPDGSTGTGTITFISRTASKAMSSVGIEESRCRVELEVPELPGLLGAGQQVDVTFSIVKARAVLTVPTTAVIPKGQVSMVYVVRNGKAVMVPVETGQSEGGQVELRSGLLEGDRVIRDPYEAGIHDGSRVTAAEQES